MAGPHHGLNILSLPDTLLLLNICILSFPPFFPSPTLFFSIQPFLDTPPRFLRFPASIPPRAARDSARNTLAIAFLLFHLTANLSLCAPGLFALFNLHASKFPRRLAAIAAALHAKVQRVSALKINQLRWFALSAVSSWENFGPRYRIIRYLDSNL